MKEILLEKMKPQSKEETENVRSLDLCLHWLKCSKIKQNLKKKAFVVNSHFFFTKKNRRLKISKQDEMHVEQKSTCVK